MKNIILFAIALLFVTHSVRAQSCDPGFQVKLCKSGTDYSIRVEADETSTAHTWKLYERPTCTNSISNGILLQTVTGANTTYTFTNISPNKCYQVSHTVTPDDHCFAEQRRLIDEVDPNNELITLFGYLFSQSCGDGSFGTSAKIVASFDSRFFPAGTVIQWQRFITATNTWVNAGTGTSLETCVNGLYKAVATDNCGNIIEEKIQLTELVCCARIPGLVEGGGALALSGAQEDGDLSQNVPNPFQGVTEIAYQLPKGLTSGQLVIADVSGKIIKTLELESPRGSIELTTPELESGMYFYSLVANGKVLKSRQMVVVR